MVWTVVWTGTNWPHFSQGPIQQLWGEQRTSRSVPFTHLWARGAWRSWAPGQPWWAGGGQRAEACRPLSGPRLPLPWLREQRKGSTGSSVQVTTDTQPHLFSVQSSVDTFRPKRELCPHSREDYDRYYRSGSGAEDYFRRKDEAFRDPYRDPWNGRREPEGTC